MKQLIIHKSQGSRGLLAATVEKVTGLVSFDSLEIMELPPVARFQGKRFINATRSSIPIEIETLPLAQVLAEGVHPGGNSEIVFKYRAPPRQRVAETRNILIKNSNYI